MQISIFNNKHDNQAKPGERTWEQICEKIKDPAVRSEKDGYLFSPAIFKNNTRNKESVIELSQLVLDYDHDADLNRDIAVWKAFGLTFAAYTTHSSYRVTESNPGAEERFRVIIPLTEPIPANLFPSLWKWAANASQGKIDPSAKDSSRMFYTPAIAGDQADYKYEIHDGAYLNWKSLDLKEEEKVEPRPNLTPSTPPSSYAESALTREVAAVVMASNGSRNDQLNRSAYSLGQLVGANLLEEWQVRESLERAAIGAGLDSKEVVSTVKSGLEAGKKEPRKVEIKPVPQRKTTRVPGIAPAPEGVEIENLDSPLRSSDWDDPIPIDAAERPPFPIETLSPILAEFVSAVSYTTQTPADLAGTLALTAIAAAVTGKIRLVVKPGWVEWATLYALSAAPSGSRKSAVFTFVMQPILDYEHAERKRMKPIVERNKHQKAVKDAQLKEAMRQLNKAKKEEERKNAQATVDELTRELLGIREMELPQILAEDITTEALAMLLGKNNERLTIMSPEGDVFKLIAGMYNQNGRSNMSLWLKSYDGEFCRINRVDQGRAIILNHPSLAIGLSPQPGVVRSLAAEPEFLDRGLVQRFLFSFPPDLLGYRDVQATDVPDSIKKNYSKLITRLMSLEMPLNGEGEPDLWVVRFKKAAQVRIAEYQQEVEDLLKFKDVPDGLREWRSKMPGKMARLALFLHLGDVGLSDDGDIPEIGLSVVDRAITLIRYYSEHSEIAFGLMSKDRSFEGARSILNWVQKQGKAHFTRRECFRALQRHFSSPDAMGPSIKLLFQLGYIRQDGKEGKKGAGYDVNPYWIEMTQVSTEPEIISDSNLSRLRELSTPVNGAVDGLSQVEPRTYV